VRKGVAENRQSSEAARKGGFCIPEMKPKKQDKPKKKLTPMRPERPQPEVHQQINYGVGFRLAKGFAILRGGDV
jgi:hypothetical protein